MLTAAIIDDEIDSIEALTNLIHLYNLNIEVIETGHTVQDGVDIIKKIKPQLLFLDIRLGDELSFSIFEQVQPKDVQIIFISAHDNYAIRAFKYSAVYFLLKPIDPDELIVAVNKVEENVNANSTSIQHLEILLTNFGATRPFMLSVPTSDGLEFVNINDIVNINAEGSYSVLHFIGKENMMVSKNIGELQEQLPNEEFCRVHNSYLINLKHVKKLKRKGGLAAQMPFGKDIPIARNRKESFMEKIQSFVIHK